MRNQRFTLPFDQPFVLAAHALAASACQEQNGAGGNGVFGSWQLSSRAAKNQAL
jgi:hypothetical protein